MLGENLLSSPPPTLLPEFPEMVVKQRIISGASLSEIVKEFPESSLVWSYLSREAKNSGNIISAYAYARVGYHRSLDALRKSGWKGHGEVPFSHEPNRGFLMCLYLLGQLAEEIGELSEAKRIQNFLDNSDSTAVKKLQEILKTAINT